MDERSDFGALAGILRRRLWVVIVAVAVGVGAALVFSHSQQKQYQSTSVLLFKDVLLDVQVTGVPLQIPSSDPTVESATDVGLLSQENVRAQAAQQLGPPYTAQSLKDHVNISPQGKSNLVGVQATASTPETAARVANAVATAYIRIANQQITGEITAAQNRLRSQINVKRLKPAARNGLRDALTKLSVLASLGPGDVHLVQPAVPPTSPSSPKPIRNAIIGGLAGLVIGLALAFGVEQFDGRLRRPEDVERETGLPVLTSVPRSRALRRPLRAHQRLDNRDTEPFRRLASKLRHTAGGREIRSVLVTSSGPGSGKTTVALHLAAAAATGLGSEVFLLEADMRRPTLGALLDLPSDPGLSTYLRNGADDANDAAVQSIAFGEPPSKAESASDGHDENGDANANGHSNGHSNGKSNGHHAADTARLSLLLAGPRSENATSLLESDAMRKLMRSARADYELTVVDGPPPGIVADAIPLAKEVDTVIIVARLGKDTGPRLRHLKLELERLGIEPIGVVANFGRRVKNPYTKSGR